MSLKSMTVSKLKDLKRQVESAIHARVAERRHEIESELLKLSRLDGGGRAKVVRAGARGMVARKIGKKLDEPLIANGPKASKPKRRTKTRTTRKAANNAPGRSTLATAEHIEALVEALVEALPVEVPIESLPVELPPATPIYANVIPADVSAAA
jgi:hypothetical protein